MATLSAPTLGKLITNVRNYLNQPDPSNSFWTDQELTEYANEGIRTYFAEVISNVEGHFTTASDLNIVSGTETVALPTDCFEVRALYKKVNNGFEILPYSNDLTLGYSTQGGASTELYRPLYFFRDNNLVLRPTPQFSETAGLRIEYIRFPDTLVNGGDSLSTQISPVFKQLIEMYMVYKAKVKESLVNGVNTVTFAQDQLGKIYTLFKEAIVNRSKYPRYTVPYNPEGI
jgi:hypothetical protein